MKRLTADYDAEGVTNDDRYAEIQKRREEREGKEGANQFEGITSNSNKDDLIAALEADDKTGATSGTGRSAEKAGVGTAAKPETKPVPESVKIRRNAGTEVGTEITSSPKVTGDQSKVIIDDMQKRPVDVFLIEAKALTPEKTGEPLVFIQGAVSNELIPAAQARSRFACKKDGTVIYNARGFDDVPPTADFALIDIVKLIQFNHGELEEE